MNKIVFMALLSGLMVVSGCASKKYSGEGGMIAYSIKPDVYEYHYQYGFTGVDAMGWDPNLQYAWSRAGAALTCNIPINEELVLSNMTKEYGQFDLIHKLNGVDFHNLQSKNIAEFCTADRVAEIRSVVPRMESGEFSKKF